MVNILKMLLIILFIGLIIGGHSLYCPPYIKTIQDAIACANLTGKDSWTEKELLKNSVKSDKCLNSKFTILDDRLIFCNFPYNNTFYIASKPSLLNCKFPLMGTGIFIIKSDGVLTTHLQEIYDYIRTGQFKILSNIPRLISRSENELLITKLEDNSGRVAIKICDSLTLKQQIISACSTKGIILLCIIIMVVITAALIFMRYCKFLICGHKMNVEYQNVRYISENGKFIKKQDKYSASRSSKRTKRFITFLCLTIPVTRACDMVPITSGNTQLCIKSNCSEGFFTDFMLSYTGQTACFKYNSEKIELELLDIQHSCQEKTEYYTPIGEIPIVESWQCSGGTCLNGKLSGSKWNVISRPHPGGWFRGCSSWDDQCHILTLVPKVVEMCKVINCESFKYIYKVQVTIGKTSDLVFLEEDIWSSIGPVKIMILGNQRSVYGNKYVVCSARKFKASINSRNEHDIGKVGSIQCPTNTLNGSCSFNFDWLYKVDFDGNLVTNVDFNYKSSLSIITNLGDDIVFDLNNHSPLRLIMEGTEKLSKMIIDEKSVVENVTIRGTMFDQDSAIINYDCANEGLSQQYLCPDDLTFFLHCWEKGNNKIHASYLSNTGKTQVSCKIVNSLGEESSQLIDIDLDKPQIGLLRVERMNMISINHESNFETSINLEIVSFLKEHYIASSILIVYIIAVVIHQIHLAF